MAATKPCKIREESYDFVVKALRSLGREPLGRAEEGIVYENHLDGEQIVIKVVKKKKEIPSEEMMPVTTYEEKLKQYNAGKEK